MKNYDKISFQDFQELLRIDRDALDEALIRQPELFLAVSKKYVTNVSYRDELKEDIDRVRAEVTMKIRLRAARVGEKITDKTVEASVETDERYQDSVKKYLSAKKMADEWLALKEAFTQRSYVLKDLASLYIAGYFGVNSVKGSAPRQFEKEEYERTREQISQKRRRL